MQPLTKAGVALGIGLGGFIDGIVLHQILGWHHLICRTETCRADTVAAFEQQVAADGWFHLAVWFMTVAGVWLLFRAARQQELGWASATLTGAMLAGWGLFNLLEGLIDHQILGIHHVLPGHPNEFLFDVLFLAFGLGLLVSGMLLLRRKTSE